MTRAVIGISHTGCSDRVGLQAVIRQQNSFAGFRKDCPQIAG